MKPLRGELIAYLTPWKLGNVKLGPEDRISIGFANRLRAASIEGRLQGVWMHIPHEVGGGHGKRSQIAYSIAQNLGMMPGAPDYVFLWRGGSLAIEMKAPAGRQQQSQKLFQAWCEHNGVPYHLCRHVDEAEAVLREAGILA